MKIGVLKKSFSLYYSRDFPSPVLRKKSFRVYLLLEKFHFKFSKLIQKFLKNRENKELEKDFLWKVRETSLPQF
jgi:hypothetical protein